MLDKNLLFFFKSNKYNEPHCWDTCVPWISTVFHWSQTCTVSSVISSKSQTWGEQCSWSDSAVCILAGGSQTVAASSSQQKLVMGPCTFQNISLISHVSCGSGDPFPGFPDQPPFVSTQPPPFFFFFLAELALSFRFKASLA